MSPLGRELLRLADELESNWALVGGLATSTRAEPRFTRNVDVAIAVANDKEAEDLVSRLVAAGYRTVATVEQHRAGRLATVRLQPPGASDDGLIVDLLFATCGFETEIVHAAEMLEVLDGVHAPVAQAGHLVAMKLLSRNDDTRPQDRLDLAALRQVLSDQDRQLATAAVDLISQRGFHRQRDLRAELEAFLKDA